MSTVDPDPDPGPGPQCRLPATTQRRIHVLVPVSGNRNKALEETLASIAEQSYPAGRVFISVITGPGEPAVAELTDALESGRTSGLTVEQVETDDAVRAADQTTNDRTRTDCGGTRVVAAPVSRAFATLSVDDDDIVTVVNSGTRLPVDTFELAVAGLEEYDIVQAKRTAENVWTGSFRCSSPRVARFTRTCCSRTRTPDRTDCSARDTSCRPTCWPTSRTGDATARPDRWRSTRRRSGEGIRLVS